MVKLIALWTPTESADGFHADYLATHANLCRALPGIASFTTGRSSGGPYIRVAELAFADAEAMSSAFASPEAAPLRADTKRLQETFATKAETFVVTED